MVELGSGLSGDRPGNGGARFRSVRRQTREGGASSKHLPCLFSVSLTKPTVAGFVIDFYPK